MKLNTILIGIVAILAILLAVLATIMVNRKNSSMVSPTEQSKVESVPDPAQAGFAPVTPVVTLYKQNSGSMERSKKEFTFESGKCNPAALEVTAPGFVTLVNRENQNITVSDDSGAAPRTIKPSETTGVFLQRAGGFTFTAGTASCSVTVK
jgi:hypothetical protein